MIDYNKVFLDTTPLIYFLDNDVHFGEKTRSILESIIVEGKTIVSSVITEMEYLVYPKRTNNQDKIDAFYDFVNDCGIELRNIDSKTAALAAQIRAEHPFFKAMDALQLAAAVQIHCDVFLTNDKQLKQFNKINCMTVEEWN